MKLKIAGCVSAGSKSRWGVRSIACPSTFHDGAEVSQRTLSIRRVAVLLFVFGGADSVGWARADAGPIGIKAGAFSSSDFKTGLLHSISKAYTKLRIRG